MTRSLKSRHIVGAAALAAGLACLLASRAFPAQPDESAGSALLRQQEQSAAPFVCYCASRVPGLKRSLEKDYAAFRKRFQKAVAPLRAQIPQRPELSRPLPAEWRSQFAAMDAESLSQAQARDPQAFCAELQSNLSRATEESLRNSMRSALAQYSAAIRAR